MFCRRCGTKNNEESRFCQTCGSELTGSPLPGPKTSKRFRKMHILGIAGFALVLIMGGGFLLKEKQSGANIGSEPITVSPPTSHKNAQDEIISHINQMNNKNREVEPLMVQAKNSANIHDANSYSDYTSKAKICVEDAIGEINSAKAITNAALFLDNDSIQSDYFNKLDQALNHFLIF
ncbi:MAG: zinc-ribbon domain-containing protein [Thermoleophilia bacterium]